MIEVRYLHDSNILVVPQRFPQGWKIQVGWNDQVLGSGEAAITSSCGLL
jgi:hypothetical protein